MAGASVSDEDEIISGINVTPLVDIVLVLLVIFIVTASMLLKPTLPVELPAAATAEPTPSGLLTVSITRDGALYVNGVAGGLEDLPAAVRKAAEARGVDASKVEAFVSADVASPYGTFASVVDRLRLQGVTSIALDTRPEERAP